MKTKININELKEQLRKEIIKEHQDKIGRLGWEANKNKYKNNLSDEMRRRANIGKEKCKKFWAEYRKQKLSTD